MTLESCHTRAAKEKEFASKPMSQAFTAVNDASDEALLLRFRHGLHDVEDRLLRRLDQSVHEFSRQVAEEREVQRMAAVEMKRELDARFNQQIAELRRELGTIEEATLAFRRDICHMRSTEATGPAKHGIKNVRGPAALEAQLTSLCARLEDVGQRVAAAPAAAPALLEAETAAGLARLAAVEASCRDMMVAVAARHAQQESPCHSSAAAVAEELHALGERLEAVERGVSVQSTSLVRRADSRSDAASLGDSVATLPCQPCHSLDTADDLAANVDRSERRFAAKLAALDMNQSEVAALHAGLVRCIGEMDAELRVELNTRIDALGAELCSGPHNQIAGRVTAVEVRLDNVEAKLRCSIADLEARIVRRSSSVSNRCLDGLARKGTADAERRSLLGASMSTQAPSSESPVSTRDLRDQVRQEFDTCRGSIVVPLTPHGEHGETCAVQADKAGQDPKGSHPPEGGDAMAWLAETPRPQADASKRTVALRSRSQPSLALATKSPLLSHELKESLVGLASKVHQNPNIAGKLDAGNTESCVVGGSSRGNVTGLASTTAATSSGCSVSAVCQAVGPQVSRNDPEAASQGAATSSMCSPPVPAPMPSMVLKPQTPGAARSLSPIAVRQVSPPLTMSSVSHSDSSSTPAVSAQSSGARQDSSATPPVVAPRTARGPRAVALQVPCEEVPHALPTAAGHSRAPMDDPISQVLDNRERALRQMRANAEQALRQRQALGTGSKGGDLQLRPRHTSGSCGPEVQRSTSPLSSSRTPGSPQNSQSMRMRSVLQPATACGEAGPATARSPSPPGHHRVVPTQMSSRSDTPMRQGPVHVPSVRVSHGPVPSVSPARQHQASSPHLRCGASGMR